MHPLRVQAHQALHRLGAEVEDAQVVARLDEVAGHGAAHVAQADEGDAHGVSWRCACQRRLMVVLTPVFTEASSNQRVVTVLVWV